MGDFRKIISIIVLGMAILFIARESYTFWKQQSKSSIELNRLSAELKTTITENEKLLEEKKYLLDPRNFEKELRARFNYKSWGETLIILVPKEITTSTQQ